MRRTTEQISEAWIGYDIDARARASVQLDLG
jgi:hypothetical protein